MRVDQIPAALAPAFHAYGYALGGLGQSLLETIRATSRFERHVVAAPEPRIECIWHEHLPAYMASYLPPRDGRRYAWMNHPLWFMRPVHVILEWRGVSTVALGSSGHGGRDALTRIIALLREGVSTLVAVDGPAGPPRIAKTGALEMAAATGAPVVPIRFAYDRAVRVAGWDRKHLPLPFSRVQVVEGDPLYVDRNATVRDASFETARRTLEAALG